MSDNELPLITPPLLVRTLSTHHWVAAETEMAQKRRKVLVAGSGIGYEYQVVRETTTTRDATKQTLYKGELVASTKTKLPNTHRCLGRTNDGLRCKRKVFWKYCHVHTSKITN